MATPVLTGTAVLDDDVLVDALVPDVIDGLREDLHPDFGVRAFRVYRVIRTWTGSVEGEGTSSDVGVELRPQPLVSVWDGFRFVQATCGLEELGDVRLTEVSLSYSYADLTGSPLTPNQQLFIAIGEAHGQGQPTRMFTLARPPFPDRVKDLGWSIALHRVQTGVPWAPT